MCRPTPVASRSLLRELERDLRHVALPRELLVATLGFVQELRQAEVLEPAYQSMEVGHVEHAREALLDERSHLTWVVARQPPPLEAREQEKQVERRVDDQWHTRIAERLPEAQQANIPFMLVVDAVAGRRQVSRLVLPGHVRHALVDPRVEVDVVPGVEAQRGRSAHEAAVTLRPVAREGVEVVARALELLPLGVDEGEAELDGHVAPRDAAQLRETLAGGLQVGVRLAWEVAARQLHVHSYVHGTFQGRPEVGEHLVEVRGASLHGPGSSARWRAAHNPTGTTNACLHTRMSLA
mmetsp:Transcript_73087/g.188544  ORF Transcript_73087/g.188544 Transcript_73087/m.188544 type:complete len:295 (-) Transcript_73087:14-898(-)